MVALDTLRVDVNAAIFLLENRPSIVKNAPLAVRTRRSGALLALGSIALVTLRVTLEIQDHFLSPERSMEVESNPDLGCNVV